MSRKRALPRPCLLPCRRALCLAVALLAALPPTAAREMPAVDVALVLAVDASGSITPAEFQLQKEGIAAAISNVEVLGVITGGRQGRIAIAYVE